MVRRRRIAIHLKMKSRLKAAPTNHLQDLEATTRYRLSGVGVAFQPRCVRSAFKPNRRLALERKRHFID